MLGGEHCVTPARVAAKETIVKRKYAQLWRGPFQGFGIYRDAYDACPPSVYFFGYLQFK